jgi:methyl-accepting chemotaxis protein
MMNEITSQVRTGSHEMREGNGMVLEEMLRLRDMARDIREDVDEMATGAEDINGAARSVSETAEATKKTIDRLDAAIGCFKTGRGR